MKKRKIRTTLVDYIIPVLLRNKVPYTISERKQEEFSYLETDLSSSEYHRLVERAMCEKESKELHGGRMVISYNEYRNF